MIDPFTLAVLAGGAAYFKRVKEERSGSSQTATRDRGSSHSYQVKPGFYYDGEPQEQEQKAEEPKSKKKSKTKGKKNAVLPEDPYDVGDKSRSIEDIKITGDARFVRSIRNALESMDEYDRQWVASLITGISQTSAGSGQYGSEIKLTSAYIGSPSSTAYYIGHETAHRAIDVSKERFEMRSPFARVAGAAEEPYACRRGADVAERMGDRGMARQERARADQYDRDPSSNHYWRYRELDPKDRW